MFGLFKRKETVSKAEHDQALADLQADLTGDHATELAVQRTSFEQEIGIESDTVARLVQRNRELKVALLAAKAERDAARITAEANAADALLWRTAREKRRKGRAAA